MDYRVLRGLGFRVFKFRGLGRRGLGFRILRVSGFRVEGFRVLRVLGWVEGSRVLRGFRGLGF